MGTAPVFDTASTVVRVVSIVSQLLVVSQKVNSLEDDKFWTLFMSGVTIMIADGYSSCIIIEICKKKNSNLVLIKKNQI